MAKTLLSINHDLIAIPLGTRLTGLAVLANGETHIWVANRDKSIPYEQWEGTFIRIEPSGRITRVTIDRQIENGEDELTIKNAV